MFAQCEYDFCNLTLPQFFHEIDQSSFQQGRYWNIPKCPRSFTETSQEFPRSHIQHQTGIYGIHLQRIKPMVETNQISVLSLALFILYVRMLVKKENNYMLLYCISLNGPTPGRGAVSKIYRY